MGTNAICFRCEKSIDTMLYLSENGEKLSMIDIREEVNEVKRKFYVNACIVLDKCFPKQKKEICKDELIESVYYERDKNYAHKDDNYNFKEDMRKQYATAFSVDICMEETMQHFQDSAVRTNVLYGLDMWVSINQMQLEKIKKLRRLGLLDVCDISYMPKNKKDELRIIELMEKEGLMDE